MRDQECQRELISGCFEKIIWVNLTTILFYFLLYTSTYLYCLLKQVDLSWEISGGVSSVYLLPLQQIGLSQMAEILLLPVGISIVLSTLQTSLTLFVRPVGSFCIVISLLMAGAYSGHPLLFSGHSMAVRNKMFTENDFSLLLLWGTLTTVFILSIIAGFCKINKMDILYKGD